MSKVKEMKGKSKIKEALQQNGRAPRDITQVRQVPYWQSESKFVLTGEEFLKLQNFFNIFGEPFQVMTNVFKRSLDDGTINVKYVDNSNNEFSQEEVTDYINEQSKIASIDKHVEEPVLASGD